MTDALSICLLDGEFVETRTARVSPLDRGFLFGDGIYEVVPCYGGRPLRLEAHLARLAASLGALGMTNPYPQARWRELVGALIEKNGGGNLGIYLQVTRGTAAGRDFLPEPGMQPTVFGFAWPLTAPRPEQLERGIAGATLEDIRWLRCDVKSIALLAAVMLRQEAARHGADEAILIRDGHLAEGSSSAVFVVKNGAIATPPASRERLPSITREVVGDAIGALDLPFVEREIAASRTRRHGRNLDCKRNPRSARDHAARWRARRRRTARPRLEARVRRVSDAQKTRVRRVNESDEYPQRVPLKVVGSNGDALRSALDAALARHLVSGTLIDMAERESAKGSYVALTATFMAESREQLVAIYAELRGHEAVRFLL